jgi:hypothetical protein
MAPMMARRSVLEKAVARVHEKVLEMVQGKALHWALVMAVVRVLLSAQEMVL